MWYVYILECADGSLYTGITTDVARRVLEHNQGKGAKALRGRRPVRVVYQETMADKVAAAKREWEMKQWKREEKVAFLTALVSHPAE